MIHKTPKKKTSTTSDDEVKTQETDAVEKKSATETLADKEKSQQESLEQTRDRLKQEAEKMGLSLSPTPGRGAPMWPPRGRARGMVPTRARAAPWWASRGRGRGRGRGAPPTAPKMYKLDNRTTVVCVHDVPEEIRTEALLRSHFQAFGEIISLAMQPNTNNFLIQYNERFMGEMAIQKGRNLQAHNLEITWHEVPTRTALGAEGEGSQTDSENQETVVEEYQGDYTQDNVDEADAESEESDERSWKR